jgi:hypothetical protein
MLVGEGVTVENDVFLRNSQFERAVWLQPGANTIKQMAPLYKVPQSTSLPLIVSAEIVAYFRILDNLKDSCRDRDF